MARKTVRCRQSNRFFALCHIAVSRLSHKAFLPPALNDEGRQSVIMRETLNVIPSECEGSAGVARESVKCHSERQRRICCYGEESGKKITAISCELSANSAE